LKENVKKRAGRSLNFISNIAKISLHRHLNRTRFRSKELFQRWVSQVRDELKDKLVFITGVNMGIGTEKSIEFRGAEQH
jgi:hypothetical protein